MIWVGALIAVAIIVIDKVLEARGSTFRAPVLAVAVGIYLPLELSVPIFFGGIIAWAVARRVRRTDATEPGGADEAVEHASRRGLLLASGMITGEALVGIILAIPFAAAQSTDVLALAPEGFEPVASVLGVIFFVLFCIWLYRASIGRNAASNN
jgi:uncharacterized oligopeptide transporter (OPT) family protein